MKPNLLRTAVVIFIFTFSFFISNAQWVSIPDTVFAKHLRTNGYGSCLTGSNQIGWQMDTTCAAILNGRHMEIIGNFVSDITGIQYFDNLEFLLITVNPITFIPVLPAGLDTFWCERNGLTSIPSLPNGLSYLSCDFEALSSLPILPDSLKYLSCKNNDIAVLPALPAGLKFLSCGLNQLTSLPVLPDSLITLECYYNSISTLPTLPPGLRELYCDLCGLSTLPALPNTLIRLSCVKNQLTSFPSLPPGLHSLLCEENQLTSLPELPNSLIFLRAHNNFLTRIPELPDSMYQCNIRDNPITCLPKLKRIVGLFFNNTLITCLPNYGNVTTSLPPLDTIPICNLFNDEGCGTYPGIGGKVYFDDNNNCTYDAGDKAQSNIKVRLSKGGNLEKETYTRNGGFFLSPDTFGNYELSIDTASIPFIVSCPANNLLLDTVSATDSITFNDDFALRCKAGFDLKAHSVDFRRFTPGRLTVVNCAAGDATNFYGVNCASGVSGQVQLILTGPLTYVSPRNGAMPPSSVSGNQIIWSIPDFGAVDFFNDFNVMLRTDTTAVIGSKGCLTLMITPLSGDNNPANNTINQCFIVRGSNDPNDKQVSPPDDIDTTQKWLTYTIRFQNTGTDTAFHIYITDTLDADLDVSSFQLLAYSHQPLVQIKENAVRFNFPNINLLDSNASEPASHGFVQYKIKIKDGKPVGTVINNTAFIYFDFNEPVITNTTTNTIALLTSSETLDNEPLAIWIYPNPASSSVTISIDEKLVGSIATVTDIMGRKMSAVKLTTNNQQLSTSHLAGGVYFVEVTNSEGRRASKKLVISR